MSLLYRGFWEADLNDDASEKKTIAALSKTCEGDIIDFRSKLRKKKRFATDLPGGRQVKLPHITQMNTDKRSQQVIVLWKSVSSAAKEDETMWPVGRLHR